MCKLRDKLLIVFADEPLNETTEEVFEQTVVIKQHNLLNYSVLEAIERNFFLSN